MVHHRFRTEHIVISVKLCPVSHIDILKVREVHLIEVSDRLKHFPAVDRRAGTGRKHAAAFFIKTFRTSNASLECPAENAVHISGIVHEIRMIHLDHLAADGKDLLRPVHGPLQRFHIVRSHFRIVI